MTPPSNFADRLTLGMRALGHPLCVGLDPHLSLIPPLFRRGTMDRGDEQTALAVQEFLTAVIDRVAGRVAIIKPQIAFFEQLGWRGMKVLDELCRHARAADLLVLLDAKRGDIGSTAAGYAAAYLASDAAMPMDALTINPYLGFDSIEPFARVAGEAGRGLFVLVKTSNAGSGDLQDREIDGEPLFGRVADGLARLPEELLQPLRGAETGWSSLGVVCGATWPEQARRVREALPRALFLVPGYGAQGGSAADALRGFVPGPKGLEGGIVNSSRGILFPDLDVDSEKSGRIGTGSAGDARSSSETARWERAIDVALDRAIDELGNAVQARR